MGLSWIFFFFLGDQGFRSINIADTLVTLLTFQWSINIALVCVYMYRQFIIDMSIAIVDVYFASACVTWMKSDEICSLVYPVHICLSLVLWSCYIWLSAVQLCVSSLNPSSSSFLLFTPLPHLPCSGSSSPNFLQFILALLLHPQLYLSHFFTFFFGF